MTRPTILITGASRGLGAATARIVAEMETNVALVAQSAERLRAVAEEIEAAGGRALPIVGNVSQIDDCRRMVAETIEAFGHLDTVVNNAGLIRPIALIADTHPEAWQTNLAVNLYGPFVLVQAALPHLRQRNGRVLNVSSGVASRAAPGWGAYSVAKAGLNQLTRVLAAEEPDITSIAFGPGVMDTGMQAQIRQEGAEGMPKDEHAKYIRYHKEGQLLPPEVPGCALAVLTLHARPEWSGAYLTWDSESVQTLVRQYACSSSV